MIRKKVILLLSGGFDSSIAGFLLGEKGYTIIPLHFSNVDFVGNDSILKSQQITRKFQWEKLYVIDIADTLQEFVNMCKHSYYFVLMKRFMLRLGSEIADRENAKFIATGESLGQVSSQTLGNIATIEEATRYRVLKPLIVFDKEKIIALTRKLKIFNICSGPETCDLLGPKHPVTHAKLDLVLVEEKKIDMAKLIDNSLATLQILR
ncbi:MAG: hypothetical protein ACTSSG_00605 [Candidatus Heimdallarchaeaceae archaeon]